MCLILFAHRAHPAYRLVVAANRDEWFQRPTAPAAYWADAPEILAGRDLEQGGTWLGVTKQGRFAAITNFRDPGNHRAEAPSRGGLVSAFLRTAIAPAAYLEQLRPGASAYNGFSLLVGDPTSLGYFSNREDRIRDLEPGIYGLSNHLLDVQWPKVQIGKERLAAWLDDDRGPEALLTLLDDKRAAPDAALPRTGVSLEWERRLSSLRIVGEGYGTRSSTAVVIGSGGEIRFLERSFGEDGAEIGVAQFAIAG